MRVFFRFLAALVVLTSVSASLNAADAQTLPDSCNVDFWDSMRWRANLEAEREMEVAAALILKPDSVLEYSCFVPRVNNLKLRAQEMFSANVGPENDFREQGNVGAPVLDENGDPVLDPVTGEPIEDGRAGRLFNDPALSWNPNDEFQPGTTSNPELANGNPAITSPYGPEDAGQGIENDDYPGADQFNESMDNVVMESLGEYLTTNFGHTTLGGVSPDSIETCDIMRQVWDQSRCGYHYSEIGFFPIFEFTDQYNDWPEEWAKQCGQATLAFDEAWQKAQFEMGDDAMPGLYDEQVSVSCDPDKFILTGLSVTEKNETQVTGNDGQTQRVMETRTYPEAICVTPGCYYKPDSEGNGGRCQR